jgi:hypothetical protein
LTTTCCKKTVNHFIFQNSNIIAISRLRWLISAEDV